MAISKTVLNAIAKMSKDELIELNQIVVKAANREIRSERAAVKQQFSVGDRVAFVSRSGQRVEGSVAKINRVNIKVNAGRTTWTVSPNLLKKV